MRFRRRYELSQPNVPADWASTDLWREWEPPRNVIAGEAYRQVAVRRLAGATKPRRTGYLVPVEVVLVREPQNEHDRNAFRAEVGGELIGYLRREIALQLAGPADKGGCTQFSVCGVLRGGTSRASSVGCHAWLDRRTGPGPTVSFADAKWVVPWPPWDDEGTEPRSKS